MCPCRPKPCKNKSAQHCTALILAGSVRRLHVGQHAHGWKTKYCFWVINYQVSAFIGLRQAIFVRMFVLVWCG